MFRQDCLVLAAIVLIAGVQYRASVSHAADDKTGQGNEPAKPTQFDDDKFANPPPAVVSGSGGVVRKETVISTALVWPYAAHKATAGKNCWRLAAATRNPKRRWPLPWPGWPGTRIMTAIGAWIDSSSSASRATKPAPAQATTRTMPAQRRWDCCPFSLPGTRSRPKALIKTMFAGPCRGSSIIRVPTGNLAHGERYMMYSHGLATIALAEAYGMTGDRQLGTAAQGAVNFILNAQNAADGGWRVYAQGPRRHQRDRLAIAGPEERPIVWLGCW